MPDASPRDLVRRCLEGRAVERVPVVLHFGPYAARLQQITYRQMCSDVTLFANSLQSAQRLFNCDGLVLLADPTVEAEACGCEIEWRDDSPVVASHPLAGADGAFPALELPGLERRARLATLLEAARRLAAVIGKDVALIPAVTGPATLAAQLRGPAFWTDLEGAPDVAYRAMEQSAQVTLQVARGYLDMGFEQLFISDPLLVRVDPAHYGAIASALGPLWNVAEFYDARILLFSQVDHAARVEQLIGIGADGLVLEGDALAGAAGGMAGGTAPRPGTGRRLLGVAVPARLLEMAPPDLGCALDGWRAEACPPGSLALCFTIPRSTPPETLHALVRFMRGT